MCILCVVSLNVTLFSDIGQSHIYTGKCCSKGLVRFRWPILGKQQISANRVKKMIVRPYLQGEMDILEEHDRGACNGHY